MWPGSWWCRESFNTVLPCSYKSYFKTSNLPSSWAAIPPFAPQQATAVYNAWTHGMWGVRCTSLCPAKATACPAPPGSHCHKSRVEITPFAPLARNILSIQWENVFGNILIGRKTVCINVLVMNLGHLQMHSKNGDNNTVSAIWGQWEFSTHDCAGPAASDIPPRQLQCRVMHCLCLEWGSFPPLPLQTGGVTSSLPKFEAEISSWLRMCWPLVILREEIANQYTL